jgi:hypothetical protein
MTSRAWRNDETVMFFAALIITAAAAILFAILYSA